MYLIVYLHVHRYYVRVKEIGSNFKHQPRSCFLKLTAFYSQVFTVLQFTIKNFLSTWHYLQIPKAVCQYFLFKYTLHGIKMKDKLFSTQITICQTETRLHDADENFKMDYREKILERV